ncbi:MAG: Hdr-like menaquinol oxidoreductase cytochrome c subunit [Gammaproteobacteria bacterium]|nr:Hdr-like menaquinol oxidoreductase cytochrome c subunit [Gammaproteobacteria bacterium]
MARARVAAVFAPALVALATVVSVNAFADGMPPLPRGKGLTCVEPLEVMRRNHMDFLNHERDLTVRGGIRGRKHSLTGCIACHAQRAGGGDRDPGAFIRIDAPGQFCHACHEFTGVKMDCFECHAAVPAGDLPETHAP